MDITLYVKLTARAWSLDILNALYMKVPGRQAPLIAATQAGRTAFGQSLAHLIEMGLVARNPGHGHPLRPEFQLTALGVQMARIAHDIRQATGGADDLALLRRRWSLPVLGVVAAPRRFSQVKQALGPITDRALSQSVATLEDHGWIAREIDVTARPLRPLYVAANEGRAISRIVTAAG